MTTLEPERRLEWVGTLLSPMVFEGRHTFELEPIDDDRTLFVNREELTGILVRFVTTDDPARDYEAMNRALKRRIEQSTSPSVA